MIEPIKQKYEKTGPKVVEALKKRHFDAYYVSTKEEALKKALEIIPENHSIGWGGSLSIDGIGLKEELKKAGHKMIDRDLAKSPEERNQIMLQAL